MNIINYRINQINNWKLQRLLITFVLAISATINYEIVYKKQLIDDKNLSLKNILIVIYWNGFLIHSYAIVFALTFRFFKMKELWNNIKKIKSLFIRLNLYPEAELKYNMVTVSLAILYQMLMAILTIKLRYDNFKLNFDVYFHLIIVFVINILRFVLDLQYCACLSLIKNYYKGLNKYLKQFKNEKFTIKQMQNIGKCHQLLIETSDYLQSFMSSIFLFQIMYSFVVLVTYIYSLICVYILNVDIYGIFAYWLSLFDGFYICVLIVPAIRCKNEVRI